MLLADAATTTDHAEILLGIAGLAITILGAVVVLIWRAGRISQAIDTLCHPETGIAAVQAQHAKEDAARFEEYHGRLVRVETQLEIRAPSGSFAAVQRR